MNQDLRSKLLVMAKRDEQVRSDLLRRGVLFDGYHSDMESVHNENAECLLSILNEHGWPSKDLVGEEASHAAWLIVQHAIGKPAFHLLFEHALTKVDSVLEIRF